MKVMVTGGTGFVGSHAVAALLRAGHSVRMLVRDPAKIAPALEPLGIDPASVEFLAGDVTDPASVNQAMDGCQGVLHAASVYAFRGKRAQVEALQRVNVTGARIVLEAAVQKKLDPVIFVSSIGALYGGVNGGQTLNEHSPLGDPYGPYMRSKRDQETLARDYQAQGHPVVIVQPGGVWGPHDPHVGESAQLALGILRGLAPMTATGGFAVVHVDDVAAVCTAAMKPGQGPKTYPAFGEYMRHCDMAAGVAQAASVKRINLPLPTSALVYSSFPLLWLLETLGIPWLPTEGLYICWCNNPVDSSYTTRESGVKFRPARESIDDTVRWLADAGLWPAKKTMA